jgi:hypothetical protein
MGWVEVLVELLGGQHVLAVAERAEGAIESVGRVVHLVDLLHQSDEGIERDRAHGPTT